MPLRGMFQAEKYPDLLVGLTAADDAAVFKVNEEQAIISTTDFFPPVVDDPYDFGAIAAANALSDVYAMGGQVLFAINLVAFPDNLDKEILRDILRGGADKVSEAGAVIAGGHSITDKEPKYGLAVTGVVHPDRIIRKGGAQAGDALLLTKPLGVGIITTALKRGIAAERHVDGAVSSMKVLNRAAAEAGRSVEAHAMTDITGFGLLGHAHEMAHLSEVDFRIHLGSVPWLPGASEYGKQGAFPGGMSNNMEYFAPWMRFAAAIDRLHKHMLFTPETSGGLLVAANADQVERFIERMPYAAVIGEVVEGDGHIWIE